MKRILLKLSGEALAGKKGTGIDVLILDHIVKIIQSVQKMDIEVAIVIGGGNLFRGAALAEAGMNRATGDHIGMLATTMNALAIFDSLERANIKTTVMSGFDIGGGVCQSFDHNIAKQKLNEKEVLIFCAGTGSPCFTTDTAAVLRAIEVNADIVFKATKVDGIYSADPMKDKTATKFDTLTFDEVLDKRLSIMDTSAFALCQEQKMPVYVFNLLDDTMVLTKILKNKNSDKFGTLVGELKW
jgi:uridylate kinase